jgi:exopolysaccharide biosynthesis protein
MNKTSILNIFLFASLILSMGMPKPAEAQFRPAELPLGNSTLPENRTQVTLAPGVTLTTITRGKASTDEHWVILVLAPNSGAFSSVLSSRDQAREVVARLKDAGLTAEVREERNPGYKDLPAGIIGYSVRVGTYSERDATTGDMAKISGLGYRASLVFTGEDGDPTSGPWVVRVLTMDPRIYHGEISATHGSSIAGRTTVSALARLMGALAAVNAGFFVMWPADGVPGDPAGLFIDHGKILSEATNGRIAMSLFNRNTPKAKTYVRFQHLATTINMVVGKDLVHRMQGINRKPGVIRNCGEKGGTPTGQPRHDYTCTNPNELVVITPEFGTPTPSGDGIEAVVDSTGIVRELRNRVSKAVPSGGFLVQGIGNGAKWLNSNVHVGDSIRLEFKVTDSRGHTVKFDSNDSAVNGGPGLVVDGKPDIRPVADGLVHPDDSSFLLRWGVQRHPRTMAGIDAQNRILLVTVDGHQPGHSLGLSLTEGARLMIGLGAVNAMNLDGGGSTAMVVKGELISSPSDPAGERPVGDAIFIK